MLKPQNTKHCVSHVCNIHLFVFDGYSVLTKQDVANVLVMIKQLYLMAFSKACTIGCFLLDG